MEPKLSVIVPVYNVEGYLIRCVDSIRNQTFPELEIILVDDGSTDASGKICDDLAKTDARIKVIHKQNEGQGIARNAGIESACGRYITFVDSDDYIEEETYEDLITQMELLGAELACFGYTQDDNKSHVVYKPPIRKQIYHNDEIKKKFILHFFGDDPKDDDLRGVSACMSIYQARIIKEHNIFFQSERKVLSEDTLFNLDYCQFVNVAIVCDKYFYHYCIKEDSFSKGYQKERLEKAARFVKVLKEYAKQYEIEELADRRIQMVLWISFMDAVKQEVRHLGLHRCFSLRKSVKDICSRDYIQELADSFQTEGLNRKQKMFYQSMKHKQYFVLILLAYVRNRRNLPK